jgi:transcriptional regulator with XRE-family HTH domain
MPTPLETLRKARRLSRLELATMAGVTESTIVRAERSITQPPPLQVRSLERIAQALEVSVTDLFHRPSGAKVWAKTPRTADPARDVLFIQDLARELRTTVRRLRDVLKHEPWKLPELLPSIDKRPRWARAVVDRWLERENRQRELDARALARARR